MEYETSNTSKIFKMETFEEQFRIKVFRGERRDNRSLFGGNIGEISHSKRRQGVRTPNQQNVRCV